MLGWGPRPFVLLVFVVDVSHNVILSAAPSGQEQMIDSDPGVSVPIDRDLPPATVFHAKSGDGGRV